jgi:hypothetical protein
VPCLLVPCQYMYQWSTCCRQLAPAVGRKAFPAGDKRGVQAPLVRQLVADRLELQRAWLVVDNMLGQACARDKLRGAPILCTLCVFVAVLSSVTLQPCGVLEVLP